MTQPKCPVSCELVQRAITTCSRPDIIAPEIREIYMASSRNDSWSLWIQADCSIPKDEEDPPVVAFHANVELDDDGNVESIPIVPRNAKARAKYNIFDLKDTATSSEYYMDSSEPLEASFAD